VRKEGSRVKDEEGLYTSIQGIHSSLADKALDSKNIEISTINGPVSIETKGMVPSLLSTYCVFDTA
jgi:hypothetical protein